MRVFYNACKVSKYGVFSGPYFPAFGLNTEKYFVSYFVFSPNVGKYGPEKTPYLDKFHTVLALNVRELSSRIFDGALYSHEKCSIIDVYRVVKAPMYVSLKAVRNVL